MKPFRVSFRYQGIYHYVGMYATENEAANAYNEAALRIIGPHAVLNIVNDNIDSVTSSDTKLP